MGDGGGNNIGSNLYGGDVQKAKLHSLTDYTCWLVIVTHCTIPHLKQIALCGFCVFVLMFVCCYGFYLFISIFI